MKNTPADFHVLCRLVKYRTADGTREHGVDCPNRIDAPTLDTCLRCPGMRAVVSLDGKNSAVACDPFVAEVGEEDQLPNAPCSNEGAAGRDK
jgi:hypothetical protein